MEVSAKTMQLTLSMAIMLVTTSVAFMQVLRWYFLILICWWIFQLQLRRCTHIQVTVSATKMWLIIFVVIMQMGVPVAIIQVVFSAVHYALDCFFSNYAGESFFYSYVDDSFK